MKLTIKRNQADVKGLFGGHKGVRFNLSAKADISDDENALIQKYMVGDYVLATYEDKFGLVEKKAVTISVSVHDLIRGKTVEMENIAALLALEDTIKTSCSNLKNLLKVMSTFGGEEIFDI